MITKRSFVLQTNMGNCLEKEVKSSRFQGLFITHKQKNNSIKNVMKLIKKRCALSLSLLQ